MSDALRQVAFFVPGIPATKGSTRSWVGKKSGRTFTRADSSDALEPWVAKVATVAARRWDAPPSDNAIRLDLQFRFTRPRSHYGTGRNAGELKRSAPEYHIRKPDRDKLSRAMHDALCGVVYVDDARVFAGLVSKEYGDKPGVHVRVIEYGRRQAGGR